MSSTGAMKNSGVMQLARERQPESARQRMHARRPASDADTREDRHRAAQQRAAALRLPTYERLWSKLDLVVHTCEQNSMSVGRVVSAG